MWIHIDSQRHVWNSRETFEVELVSSAVEAGRDTDIVPRETYGRIPSVGTMF